jgi:hypothetical protein
MSQTSMKFSCKPLFLFLLILVSLNTRATHVIGSEITYSCTNTPQVYRVQFKIYRDCFGIQMCANCPNSLSPACAINLQLTGAEIPAGSNLPPSTCVGQNFGTQAVTVVTAVSGFDVVQLCDLQKTVCSNCGTRSPGTFTPGIEVYVFEGNINLASIPSSCCLVNIGYSSCCRNNAISTLVSPGGLNFYSQVTINKCATPCNGGPIFTNPPVFLACASQEFMTNLGAIDPEGDSLSYSFGRSLTASNTLAPYISPFSPTVPFPYAGYPNQFPPNDTQGIHINPVTGDIRFRPVGEFVSNLVIEVRQWKTIAGLPTLMGISTRDAQFYSRNCASNTRPQLQVFTGDNAIKDTAHFAVCTGNKICFTISATDSLAAWDTTNLSWNAPLAITAKGATFKKLYADSLRAISGPKYDSMEFCWTPPADMASNLPYYFIVTAKDKTCPVPNRISKAFSVLVRRKPMANILKTNKNCGYFGFSYMQTNTAPVNILATKFLVETAPQSNVYKTYDSSFVLNHRFTKGGWHRIRLQLQTISPPNPNGCATEVWDSVLVLTPVKVEIGSKVCMAGGGVRVSVKGKFGTPYGNSYRYTFYRGSFGSNQIIRNVGIDSNYTIPHSILQNDSLFYVVIQDLNGCKDSVVFVVSSDSFLISKPLRSYDFCNGVLDTIAIQDTSYLIQSYRWRSTNVLTDSLSKRIMPSGAGWYFIDKIQGNSCVATDTVFVRYSIPIPIKLSVEYTPNNCEGNVKIKSLDNPIYRYQWFRDNFVLMNQTMPNFLPETLGNYHLQILDSGACFRYSDTVFVNVLSRPSISLIGGPTIQLDTINTFRYAITYQPNKRFEWYFFNAQATGNTDTNFVDVTFQNYGIARVIAKVVDTNTCERETKLELFVERATGLTQYLKNSDILLYPNPAKDLFNIEMSNALANKMHYISIFNKLGQIVYKTNSTSKSIQIPLNHLLLESYYFVEIRNEDAELLATHKLFIER